MQVFRTESDFPEQIQVLGVGLLLPHGQNAISVEAASARMSELSKKDKDGKLIVNEQGGWEPLTGKALTAAAKDWADRINGVEVATLKEEELRGSGVRQEFGPEDTLAAAEYYASQVNPVVTRTDPVSGKVVAEEATVEEAMDAEGTALAAADDEGGEG